jgi:MYXO-CTERM domain-containing protein
MLPVPILLRRAAAAAVAALALASLPGTAGAHVELISSSPAAGANLQTAPSRVILAFDGELDPAGSSFSVTDQRGQEVGTGSVDLEVADRNVLEGEVTISEPGTYTVEWTILGIDGHEVSGSFSFGYATPVTESPDTAVASGASPTPPMFLGLLLLALAALRCIRTVAVG